MAPRPLARAVVGFGDRPVLRDFRVDERDVALVLLGLLVHELEDTPGAREAHRDERRLLGSVVEVIGEDAAHRQKGHDGACRESADSGHGQVGRAQRQQYAADESQEDVQHVADVADDRAERIRRDVRLGGDAAELVVDLVEPLFALPLVAEYLDDLLPVHHLLDVALVLADRSLLFDEVPGALAAHFLRHDRHKDDHQQDHQRQPDAVRDHDEEERDDHDARRKDGGDTLRHQLVERIRIVGVMAHDIAVRVRIEVADGKPLHAVEHHRAHLQHQIL